MFKGTKNAFTLAEVLITLGIIGVVAAMTMPTLMGSTQEAQYKTALKKGMTSVSQALGLALATDGYDASTATSSTETTEGSFAYIISKNLKITNYTGSAPDGWAPAAASKKDANNQTVDKFFLFADGTMLAFNYANTKDCTAKSPCSAIFDTNGPKGPNKLADVDTAFQCAAGKSISAGYTNPSTGVAADKGKQLKSCQKAGVTKLPDMYQVYIYDQSMVPATALGGYVVYGK